MTDSYVNFANTSFGSKLTSMLGLPRPMIIKRYDRDQTLIDGLLLLGSSQSGELNAPLDKCFANMSVQVRAHSSAAQSLHKVWQSGEKVKALVFDATSLDSSSSSTTLHHFFNDTVRSVETNGRIVLIGRPPSQCSTPSKAIAQRALEGLSRSLAKELKKAIAVQLVYLENGAEEQLESTLRFLLSTKSSYVSGQVIQLSKPNDSNSVGANFNWSKPLIGKKVLVTGASQGIGAAISEVMARDGAELICLDIPEAELALNEISTRLNGRAITLDLSRGDAAEHLTNEAKKDGGWDVIVHNAGITRDKTIANMKPELWSSVVSINLSSQERINDALVSSGGLKNGGRIICVSSISGIAGNRGQTNYAYSKAGVIGMVESLAPILAEKNITINAVAPGFIETKMTAAIPFGVREAGRRLNSMSQGGLPIDVAETIAWLASPASAGLTSNVIRVCGQSILGA